MSPSSGLSPIPPFRGSPGAPVPKFKGLAVGINYTSRPDELKGPVNGAKDVKNVLKDTYRFREQDIILMTDEEQNRGTSLWPSAKNFLRAIDNLVADASRGDVFVFYYAGHCGQDDDGESQYIIACDDEEISGKTLREHLINSLPMGSRMTVILDACYSGSLLDLGHYLCQCAPRQRAQSFSASKMKRTELLRRNTEGVGPFRVPPNPSFLTRKKFKKAVTTTVAVIRFKNLLEKKSREDEDDAVPSTAPTDQPERPVCSRCHRAFDFSKAPEVTFLSACAKDQQTWEDTKKKGKGMTTKLLKILKNEPSIKLGDLEERLKTCLYKSAFKRVRITTGAFRRLCAMVTPKRKEKLENEYRAEGVLGFTEQTAQVGSLRPVGPEERFLLERAYTEIDLLGG